MRRTSKWREECKKEKHKKWMVNTKFLFNFENITIREIEKPKTELTF